MSWHARVTKQRIGRGDSGERRTSSNCGGELTEGVCKDYIQEQRHGALNRIVTLNAYCFAGDQILRNIGSCTFSQMPYRKNN